ncbi:ribosomal-processing cysteine protease Prp [Streptococcaceae bacterium ESL0729]|nr:ribosomal-processing cysteine protease Prp [Streptococcaceae bacterium ESL0729]
MIKAFIKEKNGKFVSYELSGHAQSGEFGHDIVCSAVSVMAITTANNIERMTGVKSLVDAGDGYLYFEIASDMTPEQNQIAQILLENFKLSMEDIQSEYGDFLEFTHKN